MNSIHEWITWLASTVKIYHKGEDVTDYEIHDQITFSSQIPYFLTAYKISGGIPDKLTKNEMMEIIIMQCAFHSPFAPQDLEVEMEYIQYELWGIEQNIIKKI